MLNINRSTPGMQNNQTNLVDAAIEKAKSGGELNATEVQELRTIAESDGSVTGYEEVFLQNLENSDERRITSSEINAAEFDPNTYEFMTEGRATVHNGEREIELEFTETPSEAKTINGDRPSAQRALLNLIPAEQRRDWSRVDKHNVAEVSQFANGLGLSTPQRAEFLEAYSTAHFNHVGNNVEWNGANLQEGIDAVPVDGQNRKYIDCEAYAEIARSILGDTGFTPLSVATTGPGQARDHQVAVYRDGGDAYVISNNEVTRVPGGGGQSNQALVSSQYPGFDDAVVDPNGAMLHDSTNYQVGNTLNGVTDAGDTMQVQVRSIDGPLAFSGELSVTSYPDEGGPAVTRAHFHNQTTIDPATGDHTSVAAPQPGDVFPMGSGQLTVNADGGRGLFQDDSGNQFHGRAVASGNNNGYRIEKDLQAGDTLNLSAGGQVSMDTTTTGQVSLPDGSSYHVDLSLDADRNTFDTHPRYQAGDRMRFADGGLTITATSATQGTAVFDDGRPSVAVQMLRQTDGSYLFR